MAEPGSPLWWLDRLDQARIARNIHLAKYDRYYRGDHPLVYATEQFRLAFGDLFSAFADNWMALVCDSVRERLTVTGFAVEGATSKEAWRFWQANQMNAESQIGLTEAIKSSEASVSVWPGRNGQGPQIAVEDPESVIVAFEPGSRRRRAAALKVWIDEWTGTVFANVYLPDKVYKFARVSNISSDLVLPRGVDPLEVEWAPRETAREEPEIRNPLRVVPMVPLLNNPRLRRDPRTGLYGQSEIDSVIPNQDAVNKLVADMILTSDAAGYPAKWGTGVEVPKDPQTGKPIASWKMNLLKIHRSENPEARFGSFTAADMTNNVAAIENRIQAIASQSRTPPHYFYLKGEFPSGESLKSAEAGLVAKARDKMIHFGEAFEEVIRLAFAASDQAAPEGLEFLETEWADPEYHTEAARADATSKLHAAKIISTERAQKDIGYSPTEREEMQRQLRRERLLEMAAAPVPSGQGAAGQPAPEPAMNGAGDGAA